MAGTLAIVGAGAKAAAIVARATILRALGSDDVPEIWVFEADHVGAAWSGDGRFSSGFLTLCTPGEKDVGFPDDEVARRKARRAVGPALFGCFSWPAYLVTTGKMADWVDRGRDHPKHSEWARYLKWVFEEAEQEVISARVTAVRPVPTGWEVDYEENGHSATMRADGVVLTGTGPARLVPCAADMPMSRVFDAETFWANRRTVWELEEGTIAIAGDGGAAGTIIAWLVEHFAEKPVSIISISPLGTLFPRGDGYAERRWFSDPSDWGELSIEHRRKLIERTEAGVISMRNKRLIDQSPNVEYRRGKAVQAQWDGSGIQLKVEYENRPETTIGADYLITAIGFDSWGLLKLVEHPSVTTFFDLGGGDLRRQVEEQVEPDLTLPSISGMPPGLHVPGLAGLAQGPGMGNLGCLGLMASSVLSRYKK